MQRRDQGIAHQRIGIGQDAGQFIAMVVKAHAQALDIGAG
jgi:hypothetical protein